MNAIATIPQNCNAAIDALTADQLVRQAALIQDVKEKVLKDGEHYGVIPGCGKKPTLLKAGAEKLLMTFRLAAELDVREKDLGNGHREYLVIATIRSPQGFMVAQGVGCCSTMEKKYRYRSGGRACPECGKEAIIKGKAEYGGGWLCFAKKGGCGAKWPDNDPAIAGLSEAQAENPDLADTYNTILKMAKKRALVDGAITATGASDFFAQDLEELKQEVAAEEQRSEQRQEAARPTGAAQQAAGASVSKTADASPTSATSEKQAQRELTGAGAEFDKEKCAALFSSICGDKSPLGKRAEPICLALWYSASTWDDRGAVLTQLLADVKAIFQIMGDQHGGDICDHHVRTHTDRLPVIPQGGRATPEQVEARKRVGREFAAEVRACANGDVSAMPTTVGPPI